VDFRRYSHLSAYLRPSMSAFHDFELCRSILETLPTGLCVVDVQKKIVFWSDGAERITGYPRYEVIGRSCVAEPLQYFIQAGDESGSEHSPLSFAIKTGRPNDAIGFLHHKAGHEISIRTRAVPVRNTHGSIVGAVAVFEDQHEPASTNGPDARTRASGCVDDITGAANRNMMQTLLRETLATFAEMQVPCAVLCFRLEGLEHFRASFGAEAASSLLRMVARTLESALWRTDFIGRWSDDQFLVILNNCREEAVYFVRERIRRMLANDTLEWWGERLSVPISIGQATSLPGDTVDSLMDRACKSLDAISAVKKLSAASIDSCSRS
jgi:diguanylate cyclase (GGDEF)-like protein/PAS domain S-box-containing protein